MHRLQGLGTIWGLPNFDKVMIAARIYNYRLQPS